MCRLTQRLLILVASSRASAQSAAWRQCQGRRLHRQHREILRIKSGICQLTIRSQESRTTSSSSKYQWQGTFSVASAKAVARQDFPSGRRWARHSHHRSYGLGSWASPGAPGVAATATTSAVNSFFARILKPCSNPAGVVPGARVALTPSHSARSTPLACALPPTLPGRRGSLDIVPAAHETYQVNYSRRYAHALQTRWRNILHTWLTVTLVEIQ